MRKLEIFADNLFAHEVLHFLSGIAMFFLIYQLFGKFSLAVLAFLISVLIDIDHYLESLIFSGFNFKRIFTLDPGNYWEKTGKITILLHSWEILPLTLFLGWIFGQQPLALTVVLSLFIHYVIDTVLYVSYKKMSIFHYFFIFRLYHKFDYKILCPGDKGDTG